MRMMPKPSGAIGVKLCFSAGTSAWDQRTVMTGSPAASISTLKVKAAMVNISIKSPRARLTPGASVADTIRGPGVRPSTIAAATIPPTICDAQTTGFCEHPDGRRMQLGLTDEAEGLEGPSEQQCERDRWVEDAACVAVEDGGDGKEREAESR